MLSTQCFTHLAVLSFKTVSDWKSSFIELTFSFPFTAWAWLCLLTRPLNFNFTCPKTKFACPRQSDLHFSFPVGHNVLTNFEVCDPFTNSWHYPTWFMPKNHRGCEDEVPDSSPLPVMYIWTTDSHSMHCNLYFFNLEANWMKLIWKACKIHHFFFHVMWYQV